MGTLLEGLQTPVRYQEFAEAVYQATMEATFTALATHLHPYRQEKRWLHPFEVLSIGGDDVFLIVPAHVALPMAIGIAQEVEEKLVQHGVAYDKSYEWRRVHRIAQPPDWQPLRIQSKVSLSSGVVIANQHTPIFFLRRLVEELLKSAKAKAKELRDKGFYGATIDFIALKSIGMIATSIRDFRENSLRRDSVHLTAKPCTAPELDALLKAVKTLKCADFPKSQLYRLREQIEKGWLASAVDYLYFQSRSSHADDLQKSLDAVWTGIDEHGWCNIGLWMRMGDNKLETILADLVEIYDFVPEGGQRDGE
jgi:CRISPR-associated protein Cmr2